MPKQSKPNGNKSVLLSRKKNQSREIELIEENVQLRIRLKQYEDQQSLNSNLEQSEDLRQYLQLREKYLSIIKEFNLQQTPNDYIIENIKRYIDDYDSLNKQYQELVERCNLLEKEKKFLIQEYDEMRMILEDGHNYYDE
jgi:hypothetical protein